jgi:hypothetical protein
MSLPCQKNPDYRFDPAPPMPGAIMVPMPDDNPPATRVVGPQPFPDFRTAEPSQEPYTPVWGTNRSDRSMP